MQGELSAVAGQARNRLLGLRSVAARGKLCFEGPAASMNPVDQNGVPFVLLCRG